MAEVLKGHLDPLELLFPDGSMDSAGILYANSGVPECFITCNIQTVIDSHIDQQLSLLEIGGGTGTTTSFVLPLLPESGTTYWFTDISNAFLTRAWHRWQAVYPFVKYGIFDVEAEVVKQGLPVRSFDAVLAIDVLHATEDLGKTLANAHLLLRFGGVLILSEMTNTEETAVADSTVGLTKEWWHFRDGRDFATQSCSQWTNWLEAAGFTLGEASRSVNSHTVFRAQAKPTQIVGRLPYSAPGKLVHTNGTFVLTGDPGGVSIATKQWLLECHGVSNMFVASQGQLLDHATTVLLHQSCVKIEMAECDTTQLAHVLQSCIHTQRIQGLIHTVHLRHELLMVNQQAAAFQQECAPILHLHQLTQHSPMTSLVLFSAAGITEVPGQSACACPNATLQSFVNWRNNLGHRAVGLQWGVWSQGVHPDSHHNLHAKYVISVVSRALHTAWHSRCNLFIEMSGIFRGDQDLLCNVLQTEHNPPDLAEHPAEHDERTRFAQTVKGICGTNIFLDSPLQTSVDSLQMTKIRSRLAQEISTTALPIKLLFECPTPQALADRLSDDFLIHRCELRCQQDKQSDSNSSSLKSSGFLKQIAHSNTPQVGSCFSNGTSARNPYSTTVVEEDLRPELPPLDTMPTLIGVVGVAYQAGGKAPALIWDLLTASTCLIDTNPPERWAVACVKARAPDAALVGAFIDGTEWHGAQQLSHLKYEIDPHLELLVHVLESAISDADWSLDKGYQEIATFTAVDVLDFVHSTPACSISGIVQSALRIEGTRDNILAACSSGYLAVKGSAAAIEAGECQRAVAAGIFLMLHPETCTRLHKTGILSPSGLMRPLDEAADGMVPGEACAAMALQQDPLPLSSFASCTGHAVVRSSSHAPLGFPDPDAMATATGRAMQHARVVPEQIVCVHLHAMGHVSSDVAELYGVVETLAGRHQVGDAVVLISHKGSLGHSVSASGLLAVLVSTMVLQHQIVPIAVGVANLCEPLIALQHALLPLDSPSCLERKNMVGGVSGTSISGDNVHIVTKYSAQSVRPIMSVRDHLYHSKHHDAKANSNMAGGSTAALSDIQTTEKEASAKNNKEISTDMEMTKHRCEHVTGGVGVSGSDGTELKGLEFFEASYRIKLEPNQTLRVISNQVILTTKALQKRLNLSEEIKLPSTLMFDYPTVRSISQHVDKLQGFGVQAMAPLSSSSMIDADHQTTTELSIYCTAIHSTLAGKLKTPHSLWSVVVSAEDTVSLPPLSRCGLQAVLGEAELQPYHGRVLSNAECFDNTTLAMTSAEVYCVDPNQRLMVQAALSALTQANHWSDTFSKTQTGVFMGFGSTLWPLVPQPSTVFSAHGRLASAAAGRVSYLLGLEGPCAAVDTACSASLVATDAAHQGMLLERYNGAVVVSAYLVLHQMGWVGSLSLPVAANGQCKTFDAAANGFGLGEGCFAMLLGQDLSGMGRICATAVNQDGRSASFAAPNGCAQTLLVLTTNNRKPLELAHHSLATHGTGTSLGDPMEVALPRFDECFSISRASCSELQ